MKRKIVCLLSAIAAFALTGAAQASIINEGTVLLFTNKDFDGHPVYAHDVTNFDSVQKGALAGPSVNLGGGVVLSGNSHAAIVEKTNPQHAEPYSSSGLDQTRYLSVGGGGEAVFTLSSAAHYFGFLWGSVDTYNTISFFDKVGGLIATFTGADLPPATGDQGINGSFYANFTSSVSIYKIVLKSTSDAFEIDNVAISAVPVPAALPLFGAALAGLGAVSRRRRAKLAA